MCFGRAPYIQIRIVASHSTTGAPSIVLGTRGRLLSTNRVGGDRFLLKEKYVAKNGPEGLGYAH